ncbi:MAG TPA: glycine betaine ABC transporter substrate-binding protein [Blastocatellia bacterium]|nr:glycine betaine ABC transporter substrate-binding protein [Blastocatellia bacterium]
MWLIDFFIANRAEVLKLTLEHLSLVVIAIGAASVIAIPLGILLTRYPRLSNPVLSLANILQTIPSLALFGFLITILSTGIGRTPAIIALFLYSLLPIIRNTYTGISEVDPSIKEAGRGMGMTDWQLLTQVELPLSLGVIIAGVRVATVISIGTATIAAAIGAGGLGMYIFRGLRMNDNRLMLAGAIPAALMALAADFALGWIEKRFRSDVVRSPRRLRVAGTLAAIAVIALVALSYQGGASEAGPRVIVGSKDFTEQVILAEIVAQSIESRTGLQVVRQFELGGDLCHRAMLAGEMDVYVEYTGTAFSAILKHDPITDAREAYRRVKQEYAERFDLEWLEPLGFNNTFAILVRGDDARRLGLSNISDIAGYSPRWRAGFGQDFMSREDGYPGFAKRYGLRFAEPPREMDLSLTYRALANRQVDVIAGNSTDGLINKLDLYQLADDRRYFPPYEAAAVARREALDRHPEIRDAIKRLAGRISDDEMRRLNYAVDGEGRDPKEVAREFLFRIED